ncbi:hypothetical protein GGI35DRAFT_367937 [Trichoderma velutinum]
MLRRCPRGTGPALDNRAASSGQRALKGLARALWALWALRTLWQRARAGAPGRWATGSCGCCHGDVWGGMDMGCTAAASTSLRWHAWMGLSLCFCACPGLAWIGDFAFDFHGSGIPMDKVVCMGEPAMGAFGELLGRILWNRLLQVSRYEAPCLCSYMHPACMDFVSCLALAGPALYTYRIIGLNRGHQSHTYRVQSALLVLYFALHIGAF